MIEVRRLTKRYGDKSAVDQLTFRAEPGRVTGFLGPNGSGKSTTMRMILGLDRPDAGRALVNGVPYQSISRPLHQVGAMLDASTIHPGLRARSHLLATAQTNGIPRRRVDQVLGTVGLEAVASRRVATFSLGMRQRLGIATALLGDPGVLLFDEPVNGLDPDGVRWVRHLVRDLAAEGRTVLLSSHLMSEMESTADHLVVIGRGRLVADAPIGEVIDAASGNRVRVRTPDLERLLPLLHQHGVHAQPTSPTEALASGVTTAQLGDICAAAGIRLHELSEQRVSLETAFMELTGADVEYHRQTEPTGVTR